MPFCAERGIGILAYSPLMQGLLTGNWQCADEVPTYRARTRHFSGTRPKSRHGEAGHEELLMSTLAQVRLARRAEGGVRGGSWAVGVSGGGQWTVGSGQWTVRESGEL